MTTTAQFRRLTILIVTLAVAISLFCAAIATSPSHRVAPAAKPVPFATTDWAAQN
jgi:hypothetical protein